MKKWQVKSPIEGFVQKNTLTLQLLQNEQMKFYSLYLLLTKRVKILSKQTRAILQSIPMTHLGS